MPNILSNLTALKAKGIAEVVVLSVNDAFVMSAWCTNLQCKGQLRFLADSRLELTSALGLINNGTKQGLGSSRCKRFSMLVEDGIIRALNVDGEHNGERGKMEDTFAEALLRRL